MKWFWSYLRMACQLSVQLAVGIVLVFIMPVFDKLGFFKQWNNCWWYAIEKQWRENGVIAMTMSEHGWWMHYRYSKDWTHWTEYTKDGKTDRPLPPPLFKGEERAWVVPTVHN